MRLIATLCKLAVVVLINPAGGLVALLSSLRHYWFRSDTFRSTKKLPSLCLGNSSNQLIGFRGMHIVCCPFCCLRFYHSRSSPLSDKSGQYDITHWFNYPGDSNSLTIYQHDSSDLLKTWPFTNMDIICISYINLISLEIRFTIG